MNKILFITVFIFLACFLNKNGITQNRTFSDGYLITLDNDTIYGKTKNRDCMYLLFYDKEGKKSKYTPSKIKGFYIGEKINRNGYKTQGKEYISVFLNEFDNNYYLYVRKKGYLDLYQFEIIHQKQSTYGLIGGALGGAFTGIAHSKSSGYYIKKDNDKTLYIVPSSQRKLIKFFEKYFPGETITIEKLKRKEYTIKKMDEIVEEINNKQIHNKNHKAL